MPHPFVVAVPYPGRVLLIGRRGVAVVDVNHGVGAGRQRRDLDPRNQISVTGTVLLDLVRGSFVTPSPAVNRMSFPLLCADACKLASVTEISTGKFVKANDPDTLVWSIVTDFRCAQLPPVLYQPWASQRLGVSRIRPRGHSEIRDM